jgi:tetratricopeptide (TPR) repeat protein
MAAADEDNRRLVTKLDEAALEHYRKTAAGSLEKLAAARKRRLPGAPPEDLTGLRADLDEARRGVHPERLTPSQRWVFRYADAMVANADNKPEKTLELFSPERMARLAQEATPKQQEIVHVFHGNAYAAQRRWGEARASYQKALDLNPNYWPLMVRVALASKYCAPPEEALKAFDAARAAEKDRPALGTEETTRRVLLTFRHLHAQAACKVRGREEEGVRELGKVIDQLAARLRLGRDGSPYDEQELLALALIERGRASNRAGKFGSALSDCQRAADVLRGLPTEWQDNLPVACCNLSAALRNLRRYGEALCAIEAAITHDETFGPGEEDDPSQGLGVYLLCRAQLVQILGRLAQAAEDAARSLQRLDKPGQDEYRAGAHHVLATHLLAAKRPAEAALELRQALALRTRLVAAGRSDLLEAQVQTLDVYLRLCRLLGEAEAARAARDESERAYLGLGLAKGDPASGALRRGLVLVATEHFPLTKEGMKRSLQSVAALVRRAEECGGEKDAAVLVLRAALTYRIVAEAGGLKRGQEEGRKRGEANQRLIVGLSPREIERGLACLAFLIRREEQHLFPHYFALLDGRLKRADEEGEPAEKVLPLERAVALYAETDDGKRAFLRKQRLEKMTTLARAHLLGQAPKGQDLTRAGELLRQVIDLGGRADPALLAQLAAAHAARSSMRR